MKKNLFYMNLFYMNLFYMQSRHFIFIVRCTINNNNNFISVQQSPIFLNYPI